MTDTLLPADVVPTAPAPVYRCAACGRPLSDPTSVARQVGPDCWAKDHPDSQPGPVRSTAGVGGPDLIDQLGGGTMADVELGWCESCNSATCDPSNHPDRVPLVDGVPVAYGEPHAEVARLRALVDRILELSDFTAAQQAVLRKAARPEAPAAQWTNANPKIEERHGPE